MILDEVFHGVLDQGQGCLIVFDEPEADNTYGAAIGTLGQVSEVVDSLYAKVRPLLLLSSGMFLQYYYRHKEHPTIRSHLAVLYDTLLQWILRLAVTDSTSFWRQERPKNGAQADAEDMKEDGNDDIDTRYDGYPTTEGNNDGNRNGYFVQDGSTTIPAAASSCQETQDILMSECQPEPTYVIGR
ncbi:hypothetical protein AZE42_11957 [Rhizopogon vesiculosus]|uniref:6S proteasome subunit Rpn6 C-terminal helix domain-containing protein n=1 Tax=Rhizopogon vesiculosus TaxID=180088 RepID=A0A1J8QAL6_9AGAM|nr:hypothetical protein AZE42_11957 [Rhizopogon vesiculosus]